MERKELYERSVNILVDAYMNNTLQHGTACACAVGNLIAASMERCIKKVSLGFMWVGTHPHWYEHLYVRPSEQGLYEIKSTGYTSSEILDIERAFEMVLPCRNDDVWNFHGLCAVIDQLDIIHKNTDHTLTTQSKARFQKA